MLVLMGLVFVAFVSSLDAFAVIARLTVGLCKSVTVRLFFIGRNEACASMAAWAIGTAEFVKSTFHQVAGLRARRTTSGNGSALFSLWIVEGAVFVETFLVHVHAPSGADRLDFVL